MVDKLAIAIIVVIWLIAVIAIAAFIDRKRRMPSSEISCGFV